MAISFFMHIKHFLHELPLLIRYFVIKYKRIAVNEYPLDSCSMDSGILQIIIELRQRG